MNIASLLPGGSGNRRCALSALILYRFRLARIEASGGSGNQSKATHRYGQDSEQADRTVGPPHVRTVTRPIAGIVAGAGR